MKTPTRQQTAHCIATVLAIATALVTSGAWAAENLYWTGATSTDYNTADNWSANVSPVGRTQWYHTYDTAHIQSYRIDIAGSYGTRGGWWINAGTENEPVQFYCETASQGISPNNSAYNYASYLNVADKSDAWAWFNGGKYNKFQTYCNIGSSSYAGHITIGNDRGVATTMNFGGVFSVKNGTVNILDDATLYTDNNMVVGQIASRNGTLTIDGGSCSANELYIGDLAGATGDVVVNSGNMSIRKNLLLGQKGTGTLTMNGGTFEVESGMLAYVGKANGTITLNDGKLIATDIQKDGDSGTASLVFNGGTLVANGVSSDALIRSTLPVTVGAGGGTIDAATFDVTIAAASVTGAGGMAYVGGGSVTYSVQPAYTGVTTVEIGTTLVVPSAVAGSSLTVTVTSGTADGVYEVVAISGADTFAADTCADITCADANARFVMSGDSKRIYCLYGDIDPAAHIYLGPADGNLSTAANWLSGSVPTGGNAYISCGSAATLTVGDTFKADTVTIPDSSAVVTIVAGELQVNTLTNATKLAIASGATLDIAGDLISYAANNTKPLLYSNEGSVRVGGTVRCRANSLVNRAVSTVCQYAVVTANSTPIVANGIAYQAVHQPDGSWYPDYLVANLGSMNNGAGKWVVGSNGFSFPTSRQIDYSGFRVFGQQEVTLHSSDDWTFAESYRHFGNDLYLRDTAIVTIDTTDWNDEMIGRIVTLKGFINAQGSAATPLTITGCGTVVLDSKTANNHTNVVTGAIAVTDGATLQINKDVVVGGTGTISLAAGTTLALPSNADRTFTTPDIVPVTLPDEGTATIKIDGGKLRNDVDYVLLNSVPAGYAEHLVVTGTALDGRHYRLADDGEGHLVMNVVSPGTVIYIR